MGLIYNNKGVNILIKGLIYSSTGQTISISCAFTGNNSFTFILERGRGTRQMWKVPYNLIWKWLKKHQQQYYQYMVLHVVTAKYIKSYFYLVSASPV